MTAITSREKVLFLKEVGFPFDKLSIRAYKDGQGNYHDSDCPLIPPAHSFDEQYHLPDVMLNTCPSCLLLLEGRNRGALSMVTAYYNSERDCQRRRAQPTRALRYREALVQKFRGDPSSEAEQHAKLSSHSEWVNFHLQVLQELRLAYTYFQMRGSMDFAGWVYVTLHGQPNPFSLREQLRLRRFKKKLSMQPYDTIVSAEDLRKGSSVLGKNITINLREKDNNILRIQKSTADAIMKYYFLDEPHECVMFYLPDASEAQLDTIRELYSPGEDSVYSSLGAAVEAGLSV